LAYELYSEYTLPVIMTQDTEFIVLYKIKFSIGHIYLVCRSQWPRSLRHELGPCRSSRG
jgi:hypothetical protein